MSSCDQCDHIAESKRHLSNHVRDYHVHVIFYGADFTPLERVDSTFQCPFCDTKLATTRTIITHLKRIERMNATSNRKKKENYHKGHFNAEISADDSSDEERMVTVPQPMTDRRNPGNESRDENTQPSSTVQRAEASGRLGTRSNIKRRKLSDMTNDSMIQHIAPSQLTIPEPRKTKLPRLTHREAILASTDSITADEEVQEDKIRLAALGRWVPLVFDHQDDQHAVLVAPSTAPKLLAYGETTGKWASPVRDCQASSKVAVEIDTDNLIYQVKYTSAMSEKLLTMAHEEITVDMVDLLNKDWNLFPQLRYCSSQLLAGAILVEGSTAIMINTIEPYCRDTILDAHYERRLPGVESSYPSTPSYYGLLLKICLLSTPDGTKLVIGTRTSNLLVTSSHRLDIRSVNLGPTTSHFQPTDQTRIFLDASSVLAYKTGMNDENLSQSQQMSILYQLKQVRSKFHHLSTYTMCRSSSNIASRLEFQPSTIWTLADIDSTTTTISQERVGSLIFRKIAIEVIKKGKNAVLRLDYVNDVLARAKVESKVGKVIADIKELFTEAKEIKIIENMALNAHLTTLAGLINNQRENEKRIGNITNHLYK